MVADSRRALQRVSNLDRQNSGYDRSYGRRAGKSHDVGSRHFGNKLNHNSRYNYQEKGGGRAVSKGQYPRSGHNTYGKSKGQGGGHFDVYNRVPALKK